jgi:hypothetical protein
MNAFIYSLTDPITYQIRYVGKTVNLEKRLYNHINHAKTMKYKRHVYYWINSLLKKGKLPIMNVLEECDINWQEREKYWIEQYKENLCNHTLGGEGRLGSRLFDNEKEIIQLITDKLNSGLYFQTEIEDELKVHRGYIANLASRKNIVFPKSAKKKKIVARKGAARKGIKLNITKPRKYTGKGYSIVKGTKPYKVMHYVNNELKLYGYFKTEQEAIEAVAKIRNH